jgi:hypothetical protein
MLAVVAVLFLLFTFSTISDLRQTIMAAHDLDAGRAENIEGEITDVQRVATGKNSAGSLLSFKIGPHWFVSPLPRGCNPQIGDRAKVSFLPNDGSRLTPVIVHMAMPHACVGKPPWPL